MALGVFVAGRYSTLFNGDDLGITRDGWRLAFQPKMRLIEKSDAYMDMLLDIINGGGNWSLQSDSLEFKPGPVSTLTQFQDVLGSIGQLGTLGSVAGVPLVMTVTSGTSAQLNGSAINTLTAEMTILSPSMDLNLVFDSALREFPIRLQLLPSAFSGGTVKHFSTT
jgi:hypothetical protein